MNALTFHTWPEIPPLPQPGEVILIRAKTFNNCRAMRQELRAILRAILGGWSEVAPGELPLRETPRGPVWDGKFLGHSLDISFSYGAGEGWIGLRRGSQIGIDITAIESFDSPAEMRGVAELYLGSEIAEKIRGAENPELEFALAWTRWEARLKCLKLGLSEWETSPLDASLAGPVHDESLILHHQAVISVAFMEDSATFQSCLLPSGRV